MENFGITMNGCEFKVLVDRGAQFAADDDDARDVLQCLNFAIEGGGDVEVHSADGFRCLVQTFDFGANQVQGEGVFALPVAGLQGFLKQLPCNGAKLEKVSVGMAYVEGGESVGAAVRLIATGGVLAEPVEDMVSIYPAEFPHLEQLFKVNGDMEFVEDVGRVALSAGTLMRIAALAKPVKQCHKEDPDGQTIRFAYSNNESSPVMFSVGGDTGYPAYGLVMPMFTKWAQPKD